jgi:hypothetical protein
MPARSASISSARPRPFSTILAPCPANASAMPWPMPLVEPVMSAVLPFSMAAGSTATDRIYTIIKIHTIKTNKSSNPPFRCRVCLLFVLIV